MSCTDEIDDIFTLSDRLNVKTIEGNTFSLNIGDRFQRGEDLGASQGPGPKKDLAYVTDRDKRLRLAKL